MPRALRSLLLIGGLAALVPLLLAVRARVSDSPRPRLMLIFDMDNQPRYKAQQAAPLFADGRAMRPPVPGTVARDAVLDDPALTTGRVDTTFVDRIPMPVDDALLDRGRERFGIYCAPCHGLAGRGDGMVARRAEALMEGTWVPPSDITAAPLRDKPDGYFYHVIRDGVRKMPAYGPQVPLRDRWAIVAWLRVLQATVGGVDAATLTPEQRAVLAGQP